MPELTEFAEGKATVGDQFCHSQGLHLTVVSTTDSERNQKLKAEGNVPCIDQFGAVNWYPYSELD